MKQLITSIFLFLFIGTTTSYACLPGGITFTTQAQIDNFTTNYPGCTHIEGNVTISGAGITNLNGLNGITTIDGYLWINSCPALTTVDGLNALTTVLWVGFSNNASLTSVSGLNGMTYLPQGVGFNSNNALTSISGFNGLTSVGLNVVIAYDQYLVSITGFSSLTTIDGYLILGGGSLTDISGFSALTLVGPSIHNSYVYIRFSGLSDISPLANVSTPFWRIEGNPNLSNCAIQNICAHIAADKPTDIVENGDGCDNKGQVEQSCTSPCAATENIANNVATLSLPNGLENSLLSKLNNAIASFQNGNTTAGINKLNAFINQVNAHSGGNITEEDAAALIAQAQSVISTVENGGNTDCTQPLIALPGPGLIQPGKTVRRGAGPSVVPNPARGSAIVHLGELAGKQGTAQLFDQQGRAVWQSPLETLGAMHRLDLSDFAAGMYFLRVQPEGEVGEVVKVTVESKE